MYLCILSVINKRVDYSLPATGGGTWNILRTCSGTMVSITHAAVVLALLNIMFFHKSLCVKIAPDLPPAERPWSATGNSDTVLELPFNFVERRADGITLTTVKTAPGCSPEQVTR